MTLENVIFFRNQQLIEDKQKLIDKKRELQALFMKLIFLFLVVNLAFFITLMVLLEEE